MRFPGTRWVQRLFDSWHGLAARSSQPPVTAAPSSPLAKETPPAPVVFLPSDGSPWEWSWLFGSGTPVRNGMADPPAPSETNPPAVNVSEPEKNHQAPANTEAIDAVFVDCASSSETASSGVGPANAARPSQIINFWPLRRSAVVSWDRGQATRQGSRKPRAFHGFLLLLLLSMRMERLSFLGPTSPKASIFDYWR